MQYHKIGRRSRHAYADNVSLVLSLVAKIALVEETFGPRPSDDPRCRVRWRRTSGELLTQKRRSAEWIMDPGHCRLACSRKVGVPGPSGGMAAL